MKTPIAQIIKVLGIMALVAAFAAAAFPARSFAAATDSGQVVVTIYSQSTSTARYQPVANAIVEFSSPDTNLSVDVRTDAKGQARVMLPAGDYYVKIVAKGFEPLTTKMTVISDTTQDLKVGLTANTGRLR
ncbi:MAG: carboxypeptidase-like regulatory domain-containing protein [Chloroflexia bacterium]